MQLVYNSDSYVVVQFDMPGSDAAAPDLTRGGFEIVDKFARREIFIEGALAERFKQGVQSLVASGPTEDQLDEFIAGFAGSAPHPVALH